MYHFVLLPTLFQIISSQTEPECKQIKDIYTGGKELCENMWDNSFTYVENDDPNAYTMWFFDDANPNDQVSTSRGLNVTNECLLSYYHRDVAAETETFSECHPWKQAACCYETTVQDVETIRNAYGDEYRWDRCGPLSAACERFFVQEACFYECDPNVGLWRYQGNHSWMIKNMPIKSGYCDAWYRACANDYFCASDGGSFFSCAKEYKAIDNVGKDKSVDVALVVIIIAIALVAIGMFIFICYMRNRERKGNPYFATDENLNLPQSIGTVNDAEMAQTDTR